MKILYFIVSVNLAAASTISSQLASCADTEAAGDTANWLKASIGSLDSNDSQGKTKLVGQKAQAQSLAKLVSNSGSKSIVLSTNGRAVRLMPFVPNRKLPSKADLQAQLIPQTAKLAPESNKPLEGQVSLFDKATPPLAQAIAHVRPSASLSDDKAVSKKNLSNIVALGKAAYAAAKSPQTAFPFLKQAEHALLDQPSEQPTATTTSTQPVSSKPAANLDQQMANEYAQMQLELRAAQQNRGNQTMAAQSVHQSNSVMNDQIAGQGNATVGSAGPPPFPLSLLPQASLKQLVRGMGSRPKCNAPAVYFGCWHNRSGLPSSGFYHYAQSSKLRYRSTLSRTASRRLPATVYSAKRVKQNAQPVNRNTLLARGFTQPRIVKVAAYPAYPVNNQYGLY
jgi:hypothetical protein